ncbi:uncharacterized protein LOC144700077 isoform X1 [Wolffia australiana]
MSITQVFRPTCLSPPTFCIPQLPRPICPGCFVKRSEIHGHGFLHARKITASKKSFATQSETDDPDIVRFSNLDVQTLRDYPREKLSGQFVAVRMDSALILSALVHEDCSTNNALQTIKYLHEAGSKVLILCSWDVASGRDIISIESFADHLSCLLHLRVLPARGFHDILQLKRKEQRNGTILLFGNLTNFKEDLANSLDLSEKLSAGVDVFVNDAFSLAHKILASTVGISQFCYLSVAGFHFEEELNKLASITETSKRPYVVIVGGKDLLSKWKVLRNLSKMCNGIIFIGKSSLTIMHASGVAVPLCLVESDAADEACDLIQVAKKSGANISFPDDFVCVNDKNPEMMKVFPCDSIQPGWMPVDVGPVSWQNISSRLLNCKKVLLIGPMTFKASEMGVEAGSTLSVILEKISSAGCDVSVVGNTAYNSLFSPGVQPCSISLYKHFKHASVVWEFLQGRTLPGVAALDKALPFDVDWSSIFKNPTGPLVVDVGSGNGMFLFGMAERFQSENFLGLEMNKKLIIRCLDDVSRRGMKNLHFLAADAASTFRSIVSSYPGDLVLVSIQCPNPDFNKPDHRWRMVRRILIEAIADLLAVNGKVFLQSDVEEVARRMKEDFMAHGIGPLAVEGDESGEWMRENPFGVRSDWERHVLAQSKPMYRALLCKKAPV